MKPFIILLLFFISLVAGCSNDNNSEDKPGKFDASRGNSISAKTFEGIYFSGSQVRMLHLCDTSEDLWVVDSSHGSLDAKYYGLRLGTHQPAYVKLKGEIFPTKDKALSEKYKNTFIVYGVDFIDKFKNQIDCPEFKILFGGHGEEPPWRVSISKNEIVFYLGYGNDKSIYPYNDPEFENGITTFKSSISDVLGESKITIIITAAQCFDVMSGDKYDYSIQVVKDEKIFFGCGEDMSVEK